MNFEDAANILDPETSLDTLNKIEYYAGFRGEDAVQEAVTEACRVAAWVLRHLHPDDNSTIDLIVRAEAAEAKCEELDKIIREYQEELIPKYRAQVKEANAVSKDLMEQFKRSSENYHAGIKLSESMRRQAEYRAIKAEKERDTAIHQLHGNCPSCKNYTPNHNEGLCASCKHEYYQYQNYSATDNWEWNGWQG